MAGVFLRRSTSWDAHLLAVKHVLLGEEMGVAIDDPLLGFNL